jgi:hypothetical protein
MMGLKRRKRVEGWAVDVPESAEQDRPGILRRIGDSNKAWYVCLALIVLAGVFLMKKADVTMSPAGSADEPRRAPTEYRDYSKYLQFEQDLRADKRFAGAVVRDRFLSPGQFQITVNGMASADEVEYLAKWSAERIRHIFGHRVVVQVYRLSGSGEAKKLMAIVQWEPKKDGYAVTFQTGSEFGD